MNRSRRAVALVSTVMLAAMAAAITLVIVGQALDSTRREGQRIDRANAQTLAEEELEQITVELGIDPHHYYFVVGENERARICTHGNNAVIEPGNDWPENCGTNWDYTEAAAPGPVRVEYIPPSLDDGRLTVRILARSFGTEAGVTASFVPDSTDRFTLAAVGDLDLTPLNGTLTGGIAATGTLTFDPPTPDRWSATANAFSTSPAAAATAYPDSRFMYLDEGPRVANTSATELSSSIPALLERSCSTPASVVAGRATSLCIAPGEPLVADGGATFTVPADTSNVLLLFGASDETVDVYTATTQGSYPTTCTGTCDLAASSASALSAGTHPAALSFWTLAGTALLPESGLVTSAFDTTISLCGEVFATEQACDVHTAGTTAPGAVVPASLTVVAGSTVSPRSITIGGPVDVAEGHTFGAVATKQLVVPYWARPQTGDLAVTGNFLALGLGVETTVQATTTTSILSVTPESGAAIVTLPSEASGAVIGGTFSLTGSFAATDLEPQLELFDTVSYSPAPSGYATASPLFPAPKGTWRLVAEAALTPGEVCGLALCDGY